MEEEAEVILHRQRGVGVNVNLDLRQRDVDVSVDPNRRNVEAFPDGRVVNVSAKRRRIRSARRSNKAHNCRQCQPQKCRIQPTERRATQTSALMSSASGLQGDKPGRPTTQPKRQQPFSLDLLPPNAAYATARGNGLYLVLSRPTAAFPQNRLAAPAPTRAGE